MSTLTPETQDEQDTANDPQSVRARKQADTEDMLRQAENGNAPVEDNPTNSTDIANAEETAGGYINKFTGNAQQASKGKAFWKKRGPLIAIGGTLGIGGVAILFLLVPGILLFHILANAFGTLDPSSTALTQVTKIMLMNKLGANDATAGSCSIIKVACRFKTPSNELLRELKDNGITALGSDGNPINLNTDAKWPSERPKAFKISSFATENGQELTIKASELKSALQSNSAFRLGFNKVVKKIGVRAFSRFSPSFLKVLSKFHIGLTDKLNIKQRITDKGKAAVSEILDKSVDSLFGEGTAASAKGLASTVSLTVNKALTRVDKVSKGSGVVLAMAAQCMVNQVPGMLKKALVGVQESAAVNMAAPVVTSISATKAGDGDPDTASALGTMFNQTDSNGKSPLDAAGMQYILNQSKDTASDPTYQTVTPAGFGDLGSQLDIGDKILNNPVSAGACTLITNPISGAVVAAGVNAAVTASGGADFGLSILVNWGLGEAFSLLLNSTTGLISDTLGNFLSSSVGNIAQPTIQKMKQPGQTFGNVFTFGVGAITTNAGANNFGHYATTDQLPTLSKSIQQQQLADAELDRATLSPLDPSSPYTFMGSIMNQLTPYYSSFSSVGGSLSFVGSLLPISFGSIFKPSTVSAADTSLYEGACPDTSSLQTSETDSKTLAANIFCQPVPDITIPNDWNPSDTEASMENMQTDGTNEIDPSTGLATTPKNPVEQTVKDTVSSVTSLIPGSTLSYADWLDTCSDPANAVDCAGTDSTSQTYSLYNAANTASILLDDDISAAQTAAGTPSDGTTPSTSTSADATDSFDNSSVAVNTSIPQTIASLLGLISPIHNLLRAYGSTLFSPVTHQASMLATLQGFTLWG